MTSTVRTVHGVRRALKEYMEELQKYETNSALQTADGKQFYALIKECVEEVLIAQDKYMKRTRKHESVWVANDVGEGEGTERIREKILPRLTEARKVMPKVWYATDGFEPLWRYVESFCGGTDLVLSSDDGSVTPMPGVYGVQRDNESGNGSLEPHAHMNVTLLLQQLHSMK